MGYQVCRECDKWTNTVALHCRALRCEMLYKKWEMGLLFVCAMIGGSVILAASVLALTYYLFRLLYS